MYRACLLVLLVGCGDPYERRREEDPWEKYSTQPVPAGTFRVRIQTFECESKNRASFDIAIRYRTEDVAVSAGNLASSNGLTIFAATDNFLAAFRTNTQQSWSRHERDSSFLVADGQECLLEIVEQVPLPIVHVIPIYSGAVLIRTLEKVVTGTRLSVKPAGRGDGKVDVEVTPVVTYSESRAPGTINVTELTTRLVMMPNRPYVILAHDERQESFGSVFLSSRHERGVRRVLAVLTVEK